MAYGKISYNDGPLIGALKGVFKFFDKFALRDKSKAKKINLIFVVAFIKILANGAARS